MALSASNNYRTGGGGEFRPSTVKTRQGGSDTFASITESVFVQPSLYAGLAATALLITAQIMPEVFLPQDLQGRRFHGVAAQRFYAIPFGMIAACYVAVADRLADEQHVAGHAAGLGVSFFASGLLLSLNRFSVGCGVAGVTYLLYGITYHYTRLAYHSDSTPLASAADVKEVLTDMFVTRESSKYAKAVAAEQQRQREALIELAQRR